MKKTALLAALAADELAEGHMPRGEQMRLVAKLAGFYEKRGLIGDNGPLVALRMCCTNGSECWRDAHDRRRNTNKGAITIPWIGPGYRPGSVAVLGMNFNDASGIAMSFRLANWEREAFAEGRKRMMYDAPGYAGSMFAYRSTRSAGLLIDALDGRTARDREDPEALPAVLDRIARIQTVKCSPRNAALSKPTAAMWERCAPYLLPGELAIIRPALLVGFGREVGAALGRLPGFAWLSQSPDLSLGDLRGNDLDTRVCVVPHPRSGRWTAGQIALKDYLGRGPISG